MSVSVGDFAEQLMAQENLAKMGNNKPPTFEQDSSFYSADAAQQAPDISDVVVPDDFVSGIVEDKEIIAEQPVAVKQPLVEQTTTAVAKSPTPSTSVAEVAELKSLVLEVKDLLMEVKQTLTEMTTVGAGIGAPAAPSVKDKQEDDLKKLLRKIKTKRGATK